MERRDRRALRPRRILGSDRRQSVGFGRQLARGRRHGWHRHALDHARRRLLVRPCPRLRQRRQLRLGCDAKTASGASIPRRRPRRERSRARATIRPAQRSPTTRSTSPGAPRATPSLASPATATPSTAIRPAAARGGSTASLSATSGSARRRHHYVHVCAVDFAGNTRRGDPRRTVRRRHGRPDAVSRSARPVTAVRPGRTTTASTSASAARRTSTASPATPWSTTRRRPPNRPARRRRQAPPLLAAVRLTATTGGSMSEPSTRAGNCGDTVHLGPFWIDTTAPGAPGAVSSARHDGGPTNDTTIDVAWGAAIDALSGIDGYSFDFNGVDDDRRPARRSTRLRRQTLDDVRRRSPPAPGTSTSARSTSPATGVRSTTGGPYDDRSLGTEGHATSTRSPPAAARSGRARSSTSRSPSSW